MSTVMITDAQDGVTCPSCKALDRSFWWWASKTGVDRFHCLACGVDVPIVGREVRVTLWLEVEEVAQ
jgi:Zn ribbon nucleic-acid-binding protein